MKRTSPEAVQGILDDYANGVRALASAEKNCVSIHTVHRYRKAVRE
jgi:hypothetical protein